MPTLDRNIALSVHKNLSDYFSSGLALGTPYSVYGERDMREGTKPEFPFVYLLDMGTLFEIENLPVVIMQLTMTRVALEMGGLATGCELHLHVFVKDGGQGYDIRGAIKGLSELVIYDWTDPTTPVEIDRVQIDEDELGIAWDESAHSLDDDNMALEASLRMWRTLTANFAVMR